MSMKRVLQACPPITFHPKQQRSERLQKAPGVSRVYIDDDGKKYPSVTSILNKSNRNSQWLHDWKERMISQMGADAFEEMQRETLKAGTQVHALIQTYLTQDFRDHEEGKSGVVQDSQPEFKDGDIPPTFVHEDAIMPDVHEHSDRVQGLWRSVHPILRDITRVAVVESAVFHDTLGYAGTIDCIAEYQGELRIIDWKTSKRRKSTIQDTFDNPLQLAAYLGALYTDMRYPDYARPTSGMIVVMYEDAPATPILVSKTELENYWMAWLRRYADFNYLTENGYLPPPPSPEETT